MGLVKKIIAVMFVVICVFGMVGCGVADDGVVRIHIRANSNNVEDQEVKLCVRDRVIGFITPLIAECSNSGEVKEMLTLRLDDIENIADNVLSESGFEYVSRAEIRNEYFPTRQYGDKVFPADYYDALIVELGSGIGDNWWCVAYPPLCFVGDDVGGGSVKYRSKLVELINKYFG